MVPHCNIVPISFMTGFQVPHMGLVHLTQVEKLMNSQPREQGDFVIRQIQPFYCEALNNQTQGHDARHELGMFSLTVWMVQHLPYAPPYFDRCHHSSCLA